MKYFQKLRGERVYLSPISPDDCEQYTEWVNDSEVTDNIGVSWILYDVEKEKEFLTSAQKNDYHFAIVKYDGDKLLGNTSLFNFHQVNRTAEYGIFIGGKDSRGKGYAAEASRLILNYGFNTLNLHNIMLRVFAFNKDAIACYEKLGFKTMGIRREAYFIGGRFHDEIYMDILRGGLK
ncbi:MAG: GNAT family N-acetyltransferase [Defluviitaleaceae bacterium]|nr:GNAT family N-acetyltransferase [Defluviitaleaceae bacterium]